MKQIISFFGAMLMLMACSQATEISIIPQPQQVAVQKGCLKVAGLPVNIGQSEQMDERVEWLAEELAERLSLVTGKSSEVDNDEPGICLVENTSLAPEHYTLTVEPKRKSIVIEASDYNGLFNGVQTLYQLLPPEVYGDKARSDVKWVVPAVAIQDGPRFSYRGMHMDPCRHFWTVEETKRYIDVMAMHKMNRLHWHLTEDQGWRIEIKKYPKLTEIGSVRKSTIIGSLWENLEYEKEHGQMKEDGIPYGGFYTQDEAREIVAYAWNRGITVIPEIDLPGHMLGALAAYPELGCTGGPYEVWTRWGVSDEVLCPGKEAMFTFLEGVFDELMEIFPSEYMHIGGDECPKTAWEKCPACQRRIKTLGLKSDAKGTKEQKLQNYVTSRLQDYLAKHGRKIIGWDEILEGELAPGATVMSWRGAEGGVAAAKAGFDAIMTPNTYCYFDYYQSDKPELEPLAIGGCLPLEKVYSCDPFEGIPEDCQHHILGVQANLWTEYISTTEYLEYMLLPRMDALSEVQWCAPEVKDYNQFLGRVEKMFKAYDVLGYTYSRVAFGEPGMKGVPGGSAK